MDRMRAPKSNPIESFSGPFPIESNQIESVDGCKTRTTNNKMYWTKQRSVLIYIYIYEFFYIFSSNRNTIPNDFFFLLCFYQIMIYLLIVTAAIPILSPSLA